MPSVNEELVKLQIRRHSPTDCVGLVLFLPRTRLTVVPYSDERTGYNCVILEGNETYPRGGFHIFVSNLEIQTGIERELGPCLG